MKKPNMNKKPNPHLMALINYFALLPLVYFIPDLVAQFFGGNKLLQVAVAVAIIVPIISYLVVPCSVKILMKMSR